MTAAAIIGSLMVLVSSSMPADYSTKLMSDLIQLKQAGIDVSVKMQGMTTQSRVWVAQTITAAHKMQDGTRAIPDIPFDIDSTPFKTLNITRVPVFLYEFKGTLYRVTGAYDTRDVMKTFARATQQPALAKILEPQTEQSDTEPEDEE